MFQSGQRVYRLCERVHAYQNPNCSPVDYRDVTGSRHPMLHSQNRDKEMTNNLSQECWDFNYVLLKCWYGELLLKLPPCHRTILSNTGTHLGSSVITNKTTTCIFRNTDLSETSLGC
jgi:hypothetical protein